MTHMALINSSKHLHTISTLLDFSMHDLIIQCIP